MRAISILRRWVPPLLGIGLAILAFVVRLPALAGAQVGYVARPSGFDLNHNGIIGEAADSHLCDGDPATGRFTVDPDGDGVEEDIVFVDSYRGVDSAVCGAPNAPCRTIQFALNGSNTSYPKRVNGPANGAEDIVCIHGTFNESLRLTQSGLSDVVAAPATGTQARSFEYPKNPMRLVGWDYNRNDQYAPYDTADEAVLEGNSPTSHPIAIWNEGLTGVWSNIEIAHLTIQNYGQNCAADPAGAVVVAARSGGAPASYLYFHDLELKRILQGCGNAGSQGGHIVFNFFLEGTPTSYVALDNIQSTDQGGGYFARGAGITGNVVGAYRFQRISTVHRGNAGDAAFGFKFWYVTGLEILDSLLNLDATAWQPVGSFGIPSFAIGLATGAQDVTIRGNTFLDFKTVIDLQPDAGPDYPRDRPLKNVTIDGNTFRNTYAPWALGNAAVIIEAGYDTTATIDGAIAITNNVFSSTTGWQSCIWSNAGNLAGPQPGTVMILNNTCHANLDRGGYADIALGNSEGPQLTYPLQRYTVQNNILSGLASGDVAVKTYYAPTALAMDGNIFTPGAIFSWNGAIQTTLGAWRAAAGADTHSSACVPVFANPAAGHFQLAATDSCAKGAGVPIPGLAVDIDGTPRSATQPSVGAYEGGGLPPAAPKNLRIVR